MVKALEIVIDRNSEQPLYLQIYNQITYNISTKKLNKGDILPSSRTLAEVLNINFHTVNQAYQKLRTNGIIVLGKSKKYAIAASNNSEKGTKLIEKEKDMVNEALAMGYTENDIIESVKRIISSIRSD
ncbi:GntR family transcriptional regulator [Ferroplasma acidiphilum]|uniref:GntR family transcriptional regulator n=1 Tax=Ferroplasma acidiphilum TaxID=74969 RepID=A0A7K4FP19_9ARCH|nr:GntR family transcriptional regulator [Ferroplasma acidiphilum]NOL60760.1 GntR family transcriptional regulator [Ferroplasma acidiphilum]